MAAPFTISPQFRGPPNSGNGGYVCGLIANALADTAQGAFTSILRAPIPIDQALTIETEYGVARLIDGDGREIGGARPAEPGLLPVPIPPPSLAVARDAGAGFVGLRRTFHPICFTCGPALADGIGLRVFTGVAEGLPPGAVAGEWIAHPAFAADDGLIRAEVVWAALDCPGSVAWVESGAGGGLLGSMTCEVLRRPYPGEACIVLAWGLEASGRKRTAATALYAADGALMARAHQVWISPARAAAA